MRAGAIVTTLHVSESDFLSEPRAFCGACYPTDIFGRIGLAREMYARLQRGAGKRNETAQALVPLPGHFHAGNYFLPDVATFRVINRRLLEVRFDGNDVARQLASPTRNSLLDANYFGAGIVAKSKIAR